MTRTTLIAILVALFFYSLGHKAGCSYVMQGGHSTSEWEW